MLAINDLAGAKTGSLYILNIHSEAMCATTILIAISHQPPICWGVVHKSLTDFAVFTRVGARANAPNSNRQISRTNKHDGNILHARICCQCQVYIANFLP